MPFGNRSITIILGIKLLQLSTFGITQRFASIGPITVMFASFGSESTMPSLTINEITYWPTGNSTVGWTPFAS
jgi:predicted RND superfamily exporter protein